MARAAIGRDIFQPRQVRLPLEFHGVGSGRWAISPAGIDADSVVYSFGVGRDLSFEESLVDRYNLSAHSFDPTPLSRSWIGTQSLPASLVFHEFGIAGFDGIAQFHPPADPSFVSYSVLDHDSGGAGVEGNVHRLSTIMEKLGHDRVDILKMDIEGAEYDVIADIVGSGVRAEQFLVEFHHRFDTVGLQRTKEAIGRLNQAGYKLFYVSPIGEEFSFIRRG